jgi:hypothetical protein
MAGRRTKFNFTLADLLALLKTDAAYCAIIDISDADKLVRTFGNQFLQYRPTPRPRKPNDRQRPPI